MRDSDPDLLDPKTKPPESDSAGQIQLPEQFELLQKIDEGGMGVVYKARNRFTNRVLAVKMLPASGYTNQSLLRFQREAKASCAFSHPSAVTLFDFGLCPDGSPYFVMEFVDGPTLSSILDEHQTLDESTAIVVFEQVCDLLIHAHKSGVVHRDLKPGNIVMTGRSPNYQVKVLDFGIAKIIDQDEVESEPQPQKLGNYGGAQELTKPGAVMGTPLYMSPEQCLSATVDARSDIYSLGAVVYHCLSGTPPHLGSNAFETLQKRISEEPLPFKRNKGTAKISAGLEQIVHKCLQRDPAKRYQSAGELRAAIDRLHSSVKMRKLLLIIFITIVFIGAAVIGTSLGLKNQHGSSIHGDSSKHGQSGTLTPVTRLNQLKNEISALLADRKFAQALSTLDKGVEENKASIEASPELQVWVDLNYATIYAKRADAGDLDKARSHLALAQSGSKKFTLSDQTKSHIAFTQATIAEASGNTLETIACLKQMTNYYASTKGVDSLVLGHTFWKIATLSAQVHHIADAREYFLKARKILATLGKQATVAQIDQQLETLK